MQPALEESGRTVQTGRRAKATKALKFHVFGVLGGSKEPGCLEYSESRCDDWEMRLVTWLGL